MPTTVEAIQADIDAAIVPGFRNRLLARGQARAMVWRDGVLPPEAPAFTPQLSNDLLGYGYALLELGLRLRDLGGDQARARSAFEQAATALEAVIARGPRDEGDRSFHFVVAAASYHLARMSARAYSLLTIVFAEENFSRAERAEISTSLSAQSLPSGPTARVLTTLSLPPSKTSFWSTSSSADPRPTTPTSFSTLLISR